MRPQGYLLQRGWYSVISLCHENCLPLCETCVFLQHHSRWRHTLKQKKLLRPLTAKKVKYTAQNQARERALGARNLPMHRVFQFPGSYIISSCTCGTLPAAGLPAERTEQTAVVVSLTSPEDKDSGNVGQRDPLGWFAGWPDLEHLTSVLTGCQETQGGASGCSPGELWQNKVRLDKMLRGEI